MKLYRMREQGLGTTLISYVDNGLFMAQSPDIPQNCIMLQHMYTIMHELFTAVGLIMEHDRNKLFHFIRAHTSWDRPINLGFAPFTDETPLRPKKFWHYLGFYFDRKLTFQEHIGLGKKSGKIDSSPVKIPTGLHWSVCRKVVHSKVLMPPIHVEPMVTIWVSGNLKIWYMSSVSSSAWLAPSNSLSTPGIFGIS
jgi:hypothetical protein